MNQSSGHRLPSFFITEPMPCPYIEGMMERKLFTHMTGDKADDINNNLTHAGFRRSQTIAYRPACDECAACRSVRVDVTGFRASKNLRRIAIRNQDLTAHVLPPQSSREQFELLHRYLDHRHSEGGMADMTPQDYITMVEETAVSTRLIEYRTADNQLVACLLRDTMFDGYSMVYSFFDPDLAERSLGTYIILQQIQAAQDDALAYLYLGYLIESCTKMSYKKRFKPLEILGKDGWQAYQETRREA